MSLKSTIFLIILCFLGLAASLLQPKARQPSSDDTVQTLKDSPAQKTSTQSNVKVIAHYMPWFCRRVEQGGKTNWNHWSWNGKGIHHNPDNILPNGRHDIASVFYPAIGPYDSHDADVIEYHILTAKSAGIEAYVCDWYGPNSFTDKTVEKMLPIAERLNFRIGICVEEKALFPPYTKLKDRTQVANEFARQLKHILSMHAKSKAFLTHEGEPLVFIFNGYGQGLLGPHLLSSQEITAAKNKLTGSKLLLVRNQLAAEQFPANDGAYIWCAEKNVRTRTYQAFGALRADKRFRYCASVACPGFDDSGVHGWGNEVRKIDRRGLDEYRENWAQAIHAKADSVQIVTWNDFEEGTPIEPTLEFGNQFVDETELQVEKLLGRKPDLNDNSFGKNVYDLRLKVRALKDATQQRDLNQKIEAVVKLYATSKNSITKTNEALSKVAEEIHLTK